MCKITNIDDVIWELEEELSDNGKQIAPLNKEWADREIKRKQTLEFVPFPDNLPGWQLQKLLYLDDNKWANKMKYLMRSTAKTYGMKYKEISTKCLELMGDMVPWAMENTRVRENREPKNELDAISCSYDAKWRYMEILGGLIQYLKKNAVPFKKQDTVIRKDTVSEDKQWEVVSEYYNVIEKRLKDVRKEKIADLKYRDPVIKERRAKMTKTMNELQPYLIRNNDKRELWNIVCRRMPKFSKFCNDLGDPAAWKMCFSSASRRNMIAPVDVFYQEFNQAVAEITTENELPARKSLFDKKNRQFIVNKKIS